MADNLCGPSNALQNFQKHSTVDRTLQQDRLISRQSPSQGFRSSAGPNAGILDPEFEAFQAGQLPLESHGFQSQGFSNAPPNLQQGGPAAWAADFQRMNISNTPPQFQQQPFHSQAAQQRLDTGGWHQDFARQQYQTENPMAQSQSQVGGSAYRYSPMSGMNMTPQYAGGFAGPQAESSMAQRQQPQEAFDDEAFARAFEEASRSEMDTRQDSGQAQNIELGQDIMFEESAERFMSGTSEENQVKQEPRIGADLIHDPSTREQSRHEQQDPDALARTAAQLLDSVKNNQSSKFQNSQFLELMRQLRDREVTVEGDKIVGMNGVEESRTMGQGIDVTDQNEIASLLHVLKKLALDRDRPISQKQHNPEKIRVLLQTLLQLDRTLVNRQEQKHINAAGSKEPEPSIEQLRREKATLILRHKLQKGMLTWGQPPPQAESMDQMSTLLTELETYTDLSVHTLLVTKIHKVMKAILKLPVVPRDEEFHFKTRCENLKNIWTAILDNSDQYATLVTITAERQREEENDTGRIQHVLESLIASPDLATYPALRAQAENTLTNLFSNPSTTSARRRISRHRLSPHDAIAAANAEIDTFLQVENQDTEARIREYVNAYIRNRPHERTEILGRLLGYTFLAPGTEKQVWTPHEVHMQRVRDVLGRDIAGVLDVCADRGILSIDLDPERVWKLVKCKREVGWESEAFLRKVEEVEREVESGLEDWLREMGREGGRELSVEEQLLVLERRNKLFYMGVCRERSTLQSWRWRGMNFGTRIEGGGVGDARVLSGE